MVFKKFFRTTSPIRGGGFCLRQKPEGWEIKVFTVFVPQRKNALNSPDILFRLHLINVLRKDIMFKKKQHTL